MNKEIMSTEMLNKYLSDNDRLKIDVREEVTSTNTMLKELAEHGEAEGYVLVAESQTAGKGRLGRRFHSPIGTGVYFSILLRPRCSAESSLYITTAAAVAVCRAIEKLTAEKPQIKWVNDIYLNERKICGILTEAAIDRDSRGLKWAVLGIGINITEPDGGFPADIENIAGALFREKCSAETRAQLIAGVVDSFFEIYGDGNISSGDFIEDYRSRSFLTGRDIVFSMGNSTYSGTVIGISDEAHLVVKLDSGEEKVFSAGEVSIHKGFQRT